MLTSPRIKPHFWGVKGLVDHGLGEPDAYFRGEGR